MGTPEDLLWDAEEQHIVVPAILCPQRPHFKEVSPREPPFHPTQKASFVNTEEDEGSSEREARPW